MGVKWIVEPKLDPKNMSKYFAHPPGGAYYEEDVTFGSRCLSSRISSPTGSNHEVTCTRGLGHRGSHCQFFKHYGVIAVWDEFPGKVYEGGPLFPPSLVKKTYVCDCGSRATYGTLDYRTGHSDWCAASSSKLDIKS